MQNPQAQPIIVKKKVVHGGHHGGAWKVAYADFVTAMMALFIVLWLMSSSDQVKKAVAGYFRDPVGYKGESGSGQGGSGDGLAVGKSDMEKLKEKLEGAIKESPELSTLKDQVQMSVSGDGLRVELLESEVGVFFDSGAPAPNTSGEDMLVLLAQQLGQLPNRLLIEGHTDSRPFANGNGYSNWELSSDRANAARRLMQEHGLRPDQVAEVRGYSDQRLRKPEDPGNPSNRRVSIIVQYAPKKDAPAAAAPAPPKGGHH